MTPLTSYGPSRPSEPGWSDGPRKASDRPSSAGDFLGGLALHRRLPEGLPGRLAEVAADLLGRAAEQPAVEVLVPCRLLLGGGLFLEQLPRRGVAGPAAEAVPRRQELAQLVAGDGEQPAPERAAVRVVLQPLDGTGDAAQHVLGQVVGVGVLQAVAAGEAVQQRGVGRPELLPGLPVARVADADQQGGPGARRIGHGEWPLRISIGTAGELIAKRGESGRV
jgi:hypothetical protein